MQILLIVVGLELVLILKSCLLACAVDLRTVSRVPKSDTLQKGDFRIGHRNKRRLSAERLETRFHKLYQKVGHNWTRPTARPTQIILPINVPILTPRNLIPTIWEIIFTIRNTQVIKGDISYRDVCWLSSSLGFWPELLSERYIISVYTKKMQLNWLVISGILLFEQ